MEMKIAFDLDGVLCDIDVAMLRVIDILEEHLGKPDAIKTIEQWYYKTRIPNLNAMLFLAPEDELFIITARIDEYHESTKRFVSHFFPNAALIFQGRKRIPYHKWDKEDGLNSIIQEKARVINRLKIDVYFDDNPRIVRALRKLCKDCKTILYGGRVE